MRTLALVAAIMLAACSENATVPDQCLRADLFKACMAALPTGPVATKYNDWDEVVAACGTAAYYQSLRRIDVVRKECKP